ncbi:MAG: ABC transporter permease [Flavobacteriales bacterium]|nr:ABC transporter permease [Flavobacteriales bacterium]
MKFSIRIALRYLISRNSLTVVNRVNLFAIVVLIVSSSSLFIVLSGFDGLKDFGMTFYNQFEPDYKIIPKKGKVFRVDDSLFQKIKNTDGVIHASLVVEDKVFFSFENKNQAGYIRGVDHSYNKINTIDSLIVIGDWINFESNSIVLGYKLSSNLGSGVYDYSSFIEVSAPKKKKLNLLENPFKTKSTFVSGIFQISEEIDEKYAFSSLAFAKEILGLNEVEFSYIALTADGEFLKEDLISNIQDKFNGNIKVLSRLEQNPALYKMLNTENIAVYTIFSLVIIIALFNLIGSLIMMSFDKAKQLKLFYSLGESPKNIQNIFLFLGLIISIIGSIMGVVIGTILIIAQDLYPFVFVPGTSLAYPVSLSLKNILIVSSTVFTLGSFASIWATRGIHKTLE